MKRKFRKSTVYKIARYRTLLKFSTNHLNKKIALEKKADKNKPNDSPTTRVFTTKKSIPLGLEPRTFWSQRTCFSTTTKKKGSFSCKRKKNSYKGNAKKIANRKKWTSIVDIWYDLKHCPILKTSNQIFSNKKNLKEKLINLKLRHRFTRIDLVLLNFRETNAKFRPKDSIYTNLLFSKTNQINF